MKKKERDRQTDRMRERKSERAKESEREGMPELNFNFPFRSPGCVHISRVKCLI